MQENSETNLQPPPLSNSKNEIVEYIKEKYPQIYEQICHGEQLHNRDVWNIIDKVINNSEKEHHGMDMSGFKKLLSCIKMERFINHDVESASIYPKQMEQINKILVSEIEKIFQENYLMLLKKANVTCDTDPSILDKLAEEADELTNKQVLEGRIKVAGIFDELPLATIDRLKYLALKRKSSQTKVTT
jgi:hypothetical protein